MHEIDWQQELTRAALPHAVLAVLTNGEMHGYAMLEVLSSRGFPKIKGGTLYPLLKRLEDQGLVGHEWQHDTAGPGRKQFTITEHGRRELARAANAWSQMDEVLKNFRADRQETR